ncbi:MAG: hypothetical protein SRB2_02563 [Desulfobacteraceae bacterium Eth-SRB2]|nr:MAG: hypothetical protein SRB2_02563 [Desulfobacteraceae bacterium Eth-SRB2]
MKLKKAIGLVEQTVSEMCLSSGRPIFNEWMIIRLSDRGMELMFYSGPRSSASQTKICADMRTLEDEMNREEYTPGQFFFSQDAQGTLFDAFMVAGPKTYILFNNTLMKMTEIAVDPFWNKTQIHFVELSEHFHADALR